ncbi:hypothetical protein BKA56DRAFT_669717 [Ilyonectria sp. MPI-CAGE-AT-0026]|nr:hypothetical protein BKA56DRAFT_669717 [Ilyonectria sp. MPI-CAGE-AT-0026]
MAQKSNELMSRAHTPIQAAVQVEFKCSILKRNLVAIFHWRSPSAVESLSVSARNARKADGGRLLRVLGAAPITAWAVSLPLSSREEIDQDVFDDAVSLMHKAGTESEPVTGIALNVRDMIRDQANEEPLCKSSPCGYFVQEVDELAYNPEPTSAQTTT